MQRILAIHLGALGDLLLSFPALFALKKSREAGITLFCQAAWQDAAKKLSLTDQTRPVESAAFSSLFSSRPDQKLAEHIRGFDQALVFSSSADLFQNIKALLPSTVQVPPRPPLGRPLHAAAHIFSELVRQGLLDEIPADPVDALPEPPALTSVPNGPVVIHPGSGSPRKNWPLTRFVELSRHLDQKGVPSLFLLGPAEEKMGTLLEGEGVDQDRIIAAGSIKDVWDVYRKARAFAGNDSGLTHLAAQAGLPVSAVFGPSDPVRWKPVGRNVRVIRPELPCEPCFETEKKSCEALPPCLQQTGPDGVFAALC